MQPRPLDRNAQVIAIGTDVDVRSVEVKQCQKIHEVTFDVSKCAQVIQLVVGKAQLAQLVHFAVHLLCK